MNEIEKQLFHLGNEVVKIDRELSQLGNSHPILAKDLLKQMISMLSVMNHIRLCAYGNIKRDEEELKIFKIVLKCTEEQVDEIIQKINDMGLGHSCEMRDL